MLERLPPGEITVITECNDLPREALRAAGFAGLRRRPATGGPSSPGGPEPRLALPADARRGGPGAPPRPCTADRDRGRQPSPARGGATRAQGGGHDRLRQRHPQPDAQPRHRAPNPVRSPRSIRVLRPRQGDAPGTGVPGSDLPAIGKIRHRRRPAGARSRPRCSRTGRSLCIADLHSHPATPRRAQGEIERSWLGVPLLAAGKVIGLVTLVKAEPGFYTPEKVKPGRGAGLARLRRHRERPPLRRAGLREEAAGDPLEEDS